MDTVERREAPNGEVPRPLRPFVSSWRPVLRGALAPLLRLFAKSSIIKATNEVIMKTAQPPLKSPATPKPVRKPEARPISRAEWAGYTKEAIAKYGNTLRALSK